MSTVFSNKSLLVDNWIVADERPISEGELKQLLYVECIPSEFGYSAKVHYVRPNGTIDTAIFPLSRASKTFTFLNAIDAKEHLTFILLKRKSDNAKLIRAYIK